MATIHPGITGRAVDDQLEPLAVSPRQARRLLGIGKTRLYQLVAANELKSYRDGRARRITMESIRARIARLLAEAGASGSPTQVAPHGRRGRPPKLPANEV
jgi:excisionase family DNA binding protein